MDTTDFYTPLKQLPNKPTVDIPTNPSTHNLTKDYSKVPPTAINADSIEALHKLPIKFSHQINNELFNKTDITNTTPPKAIYYKPPSTSMDATFGLKNLNLNNDKNKDNALLRLKQRRLEISRDDNLASGDWVNPILEIALKRQVNKELTVKSILKTILYIIFLELIKRVINLSFKINISKIITIIIGICMVQIVYNIFKLFKGKDQCWDLPLSNKQRLMIGLKVGNEEDLKFSHHPKFKKSL